MTSSSSDIEGSQPPGEAASSPPAAVASTAAPRTNPLVAFFLMPEQFARAAKERFTADKPGYEDYELASQALEVAHGLLQRPDRSGPALVLLQGTAPLVIRATLLRTGEEPQGPEADWSTFVEIPIVQEALATSSDKERALVADTVLAKTPPPGISERELRTRAKLVAALLTAVLDRLQGAAPDTARLQFVRGFRFALVGLVAIGIAYGVIWYRAPKNLAYGADVSVSETSTKADVDPQKLVDGDTTECGFQTRKTKRPAVTIDLGRVTSVRRIVVTNASTYRRQVLPLLIEVSPDGKNYEKFARKDTQFGRWEAEGRAQARYIRLRVLSRRKTIFHLNEVEVYG